jgi:hypothetical protein
MPSVEETLRELDRWYNETPGGGDRPTLLSKLAVLELCGWLEWRIDALIFATGTLVGLDEEWVNRNVVATNFGFGYTEHLRRMLCRIVGESAVVHAESTFEANNPGRLEQLRTALSALWRSRGVLAHTHVAGAGRQVTVYAPSWSINQHRIIARHVDLYEQNLGTAFSRSIALR